MHSPIAVEHARRAAAATLAAVLLVLVGFSTWAAAKSFENGREVDLSVHLSDAYARAHLAVADEAAIVYQYQLEPSPALRAQFDAAAAELAAALDAIRAEGRAQDAALVADIAALLVAYDGGVARLIAAVDAGDAAGATAIAADAIQPVLLRIQGKLDAAADAHHQAAVNELAELKRAQRLFLIATPIVFAAASGLIVRTARALQGAERAARAARDAAARRELEHIREASEAERQAVEARERYFRALVRHGADAILVIDADGTRRFVSNSIERMLGWSPSELTGGGLGTLQHPGEDAAATAGRSLWHPEDAATLSAFFRRVFAQPGRTDRIELRLRHKDGSWRWLDGVATNLLGDATVGGVVLNGRDVTERKAAERELMHERDLLRLLMDSLPDHVFFKDRDGRYLRINRACADALGLADPDEAVGKTDADFAAPEYAANYVALDRLVMEGRRSARDVSESMVRADGTVCWLSTTKAPTIDADGNVTGIVGVSRDVTERRELEAQIAHQAFHDTLTGLPNRVLLADRLAHALERGAREAAPLAVLFVDLDGFKIVNDSLGHDAGDALLRAVAERLLGCIRAGDTVARFGGDEFVVLLEAVDEAEASAAAERIVGKLAAPIALAERPVVVTASVGIAGKSSPLDTAEELLKRADAAMYAAKQRGKAQAVRYDERMQSQAWQRLELESDLRQAVERGEFAVVYQPIVDLASGQISGAEALVRWHHPTRGSVSPAEFVPLAEETGMILPIGWWVLTEACRQVREWQRASAAAAELMLSVNLSPRMFQQPGVADEVARILAETGLAPDRLRLEITEGVMIRDGDASIETLRRLRALGIGLAVDDFGTGYSSLTYLQRLPVDALKIDRSFVARIGEDGESREIVRLIVGLAKAIGLTVTGEGIETEAQREALRDLGADRGQGYLFARPIPAGEFAAALARQEAASVAVR